MFERFIEKARDVVTLAQEEARGFNHNYIGTEHLLLGLLRVDDESPQIVLTDVGVEIEYVREEIARIVGRGDMAVQGQIPFTPRAKRILELTLREALSLGHNYIGPEHILLGLVRENEGIGSRILLDKEITAEIIREHVATLWRTRRHPTHHGGVPERLLLSIAAIKDEALDLGLTELASRLRAIERDFS